MVMPSCERLELSDKAKEILCYAAAGRGDNQGVIEFVLPTKDGSISRYLGSNVNVRAIASCQAGDETIKDNAYDADNVWGHRTSLEYRAAADELVHESLAERIADDTYRLTLTGYRRADAICGSEA